MFNPRNAKHAAQRFQEDSDKSSDLLGIEQNIIASQVDEGNF
jgi:hypothetical protein